ncbi:sulfotransferase [Mesorhizobium sp. CA15]|uniref:sulfotransferase family protein n=1 Tax=Mesorhizobium sp. CA15 TaxID=2876641 RepID=UPI00296222F6|nr:sulfotransferase [Mesorhizobium sp. CA15]
MLQAAISRRSVWVEKTPNHIHYTRQIIQTIPGARFIVVTRDGRDIVASLGKRYEGDFDKAFQRWIADSKASMERIEKGESILWRYEDFIESPALSIERLCRFIGVAFDPGILNYHQQPVIWGREKAVRTPHSARRHAQVNQPITDYRQSWRSSLPMNWLAVSTPAKRGKSWAISDPRRPSVRRVSITRPKRSREATFCAATDRKQLSEKQQPAPTYWRAPAPAMNQQRLQHGLGAPGNQHRPPRTGGGPTDPRIRTAAGCRSHKNPRNSTNADPVNGGNAYRRPNSTMRR